MLIWEGAPLLFLLNLEPLRPQPQAFYSDS